MVLSAIIIKMKNKNILFFLAVCTLATSINQNCPCPSNSACLSNNMCGCNSGFIGNCSTPATPLSSTAITINLTAGQTMLFVVAPIQLNNYIQFTLNICLPAQTNLSFFLWGQTGTQTTFNPSNVIISPASGPLSQGCQDLTSPYIVFGPQPNGLDSMLVLGIQANAQNIVAEVNVTQQVIIGMFLYYYILIGLIAVVGVVIAVGIGIFAWKRRRAGQFGTTTAEPNYNNIDHFQSHMPLFQADKLGNQRSICAICLQQLELAEVVRQPPCGHAFHSHCIDSWALKNLTCPVCRADLSFTALQTARGISVLSVPGNADWYQQQVVQDSKPQMRPKMESYELRQSKAEEYSVSPTPPNDDKYTIRENML